MFRPLFGTYSGLTAANGRFLVKSTYSQTSYNCTCRDRNYFIGGSILVFCRTLECGVEFGAYGFKIGLGLLVVDFSLVTSLSGLVFLFASRQELNYFGAVSTQITFVHFEFGAWALAKDRSIVFRDLNVALLLL